VHIAELRKRAAEAEAKLKRLYDAIENGIADVSDPMLKERVTELRAIRDQALADAERAEGALDRSAQIQNAALGIRIEREQFLGMRYAA
jgi:site-specific DNA recombinase